MLPTMRFFSAVLCMMIGAASCRAADPLELMQTIPLQGAAGKIDHMALDSKRDRLLVGNLSNNSLDVVELKTGKLLRQIPGQQSASGVAYVPDADRIFVGNAGGTCNVFDAESYELLKSMPFPGADNVRHDPRGGFVYLGHKSLAVIDSKSMTPKADVDVGGSPRAFRPDPTHARMYCNTSADDLCVINTDKNQVEARFALKSAKKNYPLAVDGQSRRLFVGCRKEPKLLILDADTGREVAAVDIPGDVDDLAYDTKRKRVYASCGEGYLVAIRQDDPDRYTELFRVATAKLARTSLFDPESGRLFLGVPRQEGKDGPEIRVYQVKP